MFRGNECLFSRAGRSYADQDALIRDYREASRRGAWPRKTCIASIFILLVVAGLPGCGKSAPPPLAPLDPAEILIEGKQSEAPPFGVDVFLDATISMEGFAAARDSTYLRFLEDLEGSLVSGVKNITDVRFFKFGESAREIPRSEFRQAEDRAFYHEPGIFKDTNIELILKQRQSANAGGTPGSASASEPPRVTLAVTDLFQKDQDVNIVVQQIKTGCLSDPRCTVGILAIPSAFDGTIHDSRGPSYRYRTTNDESSFRPFYLLMFGPENQLLQLGEALSGNDHVDLDHFLVIGPRIVKSFKVKIGRGRQAEGVTLRKGSGADNEAAFNLRKSFGEAALEAEVEIETDPRAFGFEPSKIRLRAFRQEGGQLQPAADGELRLDSIGGSETALNLGLTVRPPELKGDYFYVAELEVGGVNAFELPPWIAAFSSDDPTPAKDAGKTLNLDRLIERLINASLQQDHRQTKLAHFRIHVHRL